MVAARYAALQAVLLSQPKHPIGSGFDIGTTAPHSGEHSVVKLKQKVYIAT